MKILALYNLKGGVGKTASAVNLAHLAALDGCRALLWDLDPQGATSFYCRVHPKLDGGRDVLFEKKRRGELGAQIRGTDTERLDLIPADFSLRPFAIVGKNRRRRPRTAGPDRRHFPCRAHRATRRPFESKRPARRKPSGAAAQKVHKNTAC